MKIIKTLIFCALLLIPLSVKAESYGGLVAPAIDIVNAKRAARGLKPYILDQTLQEKAEEITYIRGTKMHKGHLRNKIFYPTASMEGIGWSGSIDTDGSSFTTCYLYERKQYTVGCAYCIDDSGLTLYTLILK